MEHKYNASDIFEIHVDPVDNNVARIIDVNYAEPEKATYENLFNYRYDPKFRAYNTQLAQFNIPQLEEYSPEELRAMATLKETKGKDSKKTARNGSITKAFKNL